MRSPRAKPIGEELQLLKEMIPGALEVVLVITSKHSGYRVSVKLDEAAAARAKDAKWAAWPYGASLGGGDTEAEVFRSARENAKKLIAILLPPSCPACGHVLTKEPA